MAWNTPKTDWTTDDGILASDLNEIGENLETLYDGNVHDKAIITLTNLVITEIDSFKMVVTAGALGYITITKTKILTNLISSFKGSAIISLGASLSIDLEKWNTDTSTGSVISNLYNLSVGTYTVNNLDMSYINTTALASNEELRITFTNTSISTVTIECNFQLIQ